MIWMTMPEDAVYEDCHFPPDKGDIGVSRKVFAMDAISGGADLPKRCPKGQLGLGVLGSDRSHVARTSGLGQVVRHVSIVHC